MKKKTPTRNLEDISNYAAKRTNNIENKSSVESANRSLVESEGSQIQETEE